jgi:hypothetical protein
MDQPKKGTNRDYINILLRVKAVILNENLYYKAKRRSSMLKGRVRVGSW